MKRVAALIVLLAVFLQPGAMAQVSIAPAPHAIDAADGIFAAFHTHPLVGIGEWHGLGQELDFYSVLIRDPRFAREVGNVVLEIGGAAHQDIVDRYVNGEDVPYPELRKVWTDVVGWFPPTSSLGSINIYATIRAVNLTLPPDQRIKVWLGEPAIDWSQIKSKADWDPLFAQRESHPAELIQREILARGRKALVIYGIGHFGLYPGQDNLRALLTANGPQPMFIVAPYTGYTQKSCAVKFEKMARNWPVPSLVPIQGGILERELLPPGCTTFPLPPNMAPEQQKLMDTANRNNAGLTSDALLYLGTRDQLRRSSAAPDMYLDAAYRAEVDRRNRLIFGKPIGGHGVERNPGVSQPWWVNGVPGG